MPDTIVRISSNSGDYILSSINSADVSSYGFTGSGQVCLLLNGTRISSIAAAPPSAGSVVIGGIRLNNLNASQVAINALSTDLPPSGTGYQIASSGGGGNDLVNAGLTPLFDVLGPDINAGTSGGPFFVPATSTPSGVVAGEYNVIAPNGVVVAHTSSLNGWTLPTGAAGNGLTSVGVPASQSSGNFYTLFYAASGSPKTASFNVISSNPPLAPAAPIEDGSTTTSLTFAVPALNGGATSYKLAYFKGADSPVFANGGLTLTPGADYTLSGLLSGTNYTTYYVAYNSYGSTAGASQVYSTPSSLPSDFSLSQSVSGATVSAGAGASTFTDTLTLTSSGGFSGTISLTESGSLPSGVTASISPASVPVASGGTGTATLTVNVGAGSAPGTYPITITGVSGGQSHSLTYTLTITATPDFTLSQSASALSVTAGGAAVHDTLTVGSVAGYNAATSFSASGLPSGGTATFTPTGVTPAAGGTATSDLALSVPAGTAAGPYTVTVTATGGGMTHTLTLTLTVAAAATGGGSGRPLSGQLWPR